MLLFTFLQASVQFATLDPANKGTNLTLSNGNLSISVPANKNDGVRSTISKSSGQWYWEVTDTNANGLLLGVETSAAGLTDPGGAVGVDASGWGYLQDGRKHTGGTLSAYGASYTQNDVIGVALDMDAGQITFYKNNSSQGVAFTGLSGSLFAAVSGVQGGNTQTCDVNFGATPFVYSPPAGFKAGLYGPST